MRRRYLLVRPVLVLTLLVLMSGVARGQCDNPKTDTQRAQCIQEELKGSDRTINRIYVDLMKSLPPADRVSLRNEQRSWLKTRDQTCGITWSKGDRETWFADLLRDYQKTVCIVRLTNERVQSLENYQRTNAIAPPAPVAASDSEPVYDIESHEEKSNGKWYFEVKVDGATIQKMAEATLFVGVAQSKPEAGAANENGEATGTFLMIRRINKSPDTGTLGFAIDLDNAKLYTSHDGAWEGGAPGSAGGQDLLRGRTYKAFLDSSAAVNQFQKAQALDVNFGERAFIYHIPDGYKAMQTR